MFRKLRRLLLPVGLGLAALATTYGVGILAVPALPTHTDPPPAGWPGPPTVPDGRITVAVAVGEGGNEITDVLGPYEVFSRSPRFAVYTVSTTRTPVRLLGGPELLPDFTTADIDRGVAPRPDLVVVPRLNDPTGRLGPWVGRQLRAGSRVLGVCNGAYVLAEAGLLDGRRATAFWPSLDDLGERYPDVTWVRGQRYTQDGPITTTAGVTSGIVGALRLVEQLAGSDEAERIGRTIGYPGWSVDASTDIPAQRRTLSDYPLVLNGKVPWRPTVGIGLVNGLSEIDIAAVVDVYYTSDAARTWPVAAGHTVRTRHGMLLYLMPADADTPSLDRLLVPGLRHADQLDPELAVWAADRGVDVELVHASRATTGEAAFDSALRSLARYADRGSARATAKYLEYPVADLALQGAAVPVRSTLTLALTLAMATTVAFLPAIARRTVRWLRSKGAHRQGHSSARSRT